METTIAGLNAVRRGSGPPMLLLHGIGHRWQAWLPVIDSLARDFDVVAVDLPGFGKSPRESDRYEMSLASGVDWLEDVLAELGWQRAHLVGNSLGGWLAFELALRGRAESVTALAPAGLWPSFKAVERRVRFWFGLWVGGARLAPPRLKGLLRFRVMRTLTMARLFGRPWRIPGQVAIDDAQALADSAIDEAFEAAGDERFAGGQAITAPVTVAWSSRDPLFGPKNATTDELPAHTRVERFRGCGHVPMWDDTPLVLETIRATVAAAQPAAQPDAPVVAAPAPRAEAATA